ncbi:MAG TPA: proline iminopeptidase-family hydrolase [Balneolaceae bacterium]|nr:proline iminopeptidase-family hydrolase [Balneolaceae bacterium]
MNKKNYSWCIHVFICAIAFLTLLGCNNQLKPGEGHVQVTGGRVWYKVVGTGDGVPLMVLHGGPGVPHNYMNPLSALGKDRPVIFYDQLGVGKSDQPSDTTLWNIPAFVNRLEEIRQALGLKKMDIYGHSWGTILGTEYTLKYPQRVNCLVLASPALSIPRWIRDADSLETTLPDSVQQVIRKNEEAGTYDSPEYQNAMMVYYAKYVARKMPWSADIDTSFAEMNPEIYNYMQGPSEFTFTGTLTNYDVTNRLGQITAPVLFTAGEYDEARPATVRYYESLIPGSEMVVIPNAGHLTMQDNPEANNNAVGDFLKKHDPR